VPRGADDAAGGIVIKHREADDARDEVGPRRRLERWRSKTCSRRQWLVSLDETIIAEANVGVGHNNRATKRVEDPKADVERKNMASPYL
jgi:hypothetical protein